MPKPTTKSTLSAKERILNMAAQKPVASSADLSTRATPVYNTNKPETQTPKEKEIDISSQAEAMRQRAALETDYTLPKASDPPGTTRLGGSAPSIEPERETPQALRNLGESLANKWTKGATTAEEANRAARNTSIDFLEAIPAAVQRGADQFYTGVTGAVDMLLGQPLQALGWENNPISNWNASAQAEAEGNAAKWGERIDNSGARAIADVGSQVVAALPDAALAFLSGGTSLAPQVAAQTTRGLQAASTAARAADAVGDFARGLGASGRVAGALTDAASVAIPAATEMLSNPQYWLSYAQTAGSSFNQARAEGADAAKATAYATVNGLLGAIVEMGGGIQTLPAELRQSPSQVKAWLDGMIDEGGEEIVQGVIDRLSQNVTGLANNALFSFTDENAVFNPVTAAQEGAMGALVGGIVGGGQVLVNNAINNAAQRRAQRDLDAFLGAAGIDAQARPEAVVAPESAPIQEQAQTAAPESQPIQEVVQESPVTPESAPGPGPLVEHTPVAVEEQAGDGTASVVEQLRAAIPQLQNTAPVANVTGNEIPQGGKLVDRLVRFAESIGNKVVRPGFGEVLFSKNRIKNSMLGHGVGPAKIEAFAAVPDVVRDGAQIAYAENWKGRPYNTYIFAAPINYRGKLTYVAAVVTKDANSGKYYLHEVLSEDGSLVSESKNQQETTSDGNATQTGAFYTVSSPADNNIIADSNQNVNTNNASGVMSDEQLQQEQQRNAEDIDSVKMFLAAAESGEYQPSPEALSSLQAMLPQLYARQTELAGIEQAKRVQRGEVSRGFDSPENHIDNRDAESVKGGRVAAFSFDHPQLHRYFADAAQDLQAMANYATTAEQYRGNRGSRVTRERNKRSVERAYSSELRDAMETGRLSKPQVMDACERIINNHGQENVLAAKRVELVLDDMLTNGYISADGVSVPPNEAYIAAKEQIAGARGEERAVERYLQDQEFANIGGEPLTADELAAQDAEVQRIRERYQNMRGQQQAASGVGPESSVGAASAGFVDPESARLTEQYQTAVDTYGALPERPNLARQMEVPASMDGETVVPRTVQTALGSDATSSTAVGEITDEVARGRFNKAVITDKASLARAEAAINSKGWDTALRDWTAEVKSGKVSKDLATLGLTLYNNAINSGNTKMGIEILTDLVDHARAGAQATQAMNILNKLTPEGKLYSIQRSIQNIRDAAIKRTGKAIPEITINPELAQAYINAQTQEEADAALDALYNNIAAQVPVTWYDRLNAWRYFAMLANPRTHIRNIVGNAGFAPVRGVKNIVGAGLEGVFIRDRNNRTKAISSRLLSAEDRARYRAAQSEFGQVVDLIQGGGKFNDERNAILSRRNMFIQPLEGLRRANEWALDHEDILFSKQAYSASLMQYLRAHKITAEQYLSEDFDRSAAQAYAIKEAQKATYRDANAFSDLVSKLHTRGNTAFEKGVDTLIGGILPFKRTPANILVRGMEYSPAGLLKGLGDAAFNVSRGRMTAAEAIDEIAAGLTGTGLMALGVLLSRMGLVTGGSTGDEEQDNFNSLRGTQNYAMTIGDRNFTLDWLAPEALPFFVGVELNKALDSEGSITDDIWGALNSITDPLLEMSMLSGVTDMLDSVAYADGNSIWPVLASSVTGYISQYIPTLLGQIERTMEDTRQTTYTDSESWIPSDVQYAISRAANRIPGKVEYQTREYIDAWGRPVSTGETWQERAINNFLNPSYMSTGRSTPVDDELQRLYDSLGGANSEYSVFPQRVIQGTNVAGEPLGNNEFVEYATELGQTSLQAVEDLFATSEYLRMTDKERADAVDMMYDYAKVVAANSIGRIYDSGYSKQYDAIDAERKVGIDPVEYMLIADTLSGFTSDKDEEGKTISGSKKEKVVDYIAGLDMTPKQKNYLYLAQNYAESGLADMEWNQ